MTRTQEGQEISRFGFYQAHTLHLGSVWEHAEEEGEGKQGRVRLSRSRAGAGGVGSGPWAQEVGLGVWHLSESAGSVANMELRLEG